MYNKRLRNLLLRPKFIYERHPEAIALRATKKSLCDWIIDHAGSSSRQVDVDAKTIDNIYINKFLQIKDELSEQEISDQITTFFAAAIETLSITTANCLLLLAMHPEVQQKLYDEIIRVLPDADNANITNEKLNELQYLEQVMHEALRLLPVVPFIGREATEDFELAAGNVIPKKTIFVINFSMLFRRKDVWGDDANDFNPDRFSSENMKKKEKLFIPFSMGKRNCAGYRYAYAAFKIIILKVIRNFELSTPHKYKDLKYERKVNLKIIGQHTVSLKQRIEC